MPDVHLNNYLKIIVEVLPDTTRRLEGEIVRRNDYFSKMNSAEQDDFLGISYTHSTNQLVACCDALKSLEFLSRGPAEQLQVNVTQNGVAGILRQALEAFATFEWLNNCVTEEEKRQKAHSYQMADLQERANFYKDLGDEREYQKTVKMKEEYLRVGLLKGYSKEDRDKKGNLIGKQEKPLLGITDLCVQLLTPESIFTKEVLAIYPGMQNASWLYRWSSGMAHGKFWVNLFLTDSKGIGKITPNYLNLNALLLTILTGIDKVIDA